MERKNYPGLFIKNFFLKYFILRLRPLIEMLKVKIRHFLKPSHHSMKKILKFPLNIFIFRLKNLTKGQIESEWIYEIFHFQKMTPTIWRIFALRVFTVDMAEILQIFGVIFWKIDDFIYPFWFFRSPLAQWGMFGNI